jgi:hypothetical protein
MAGAATSHPGAELEAHPAVGRFTVESAAGEALWVLEPDGRLVVLGPGDLIARGSWERGPGTSDLDADLHVRITGQDLRALGAVSPDGDRLALYVEAGEPTAADDGAAWPPVSRLVGKRVVAVVDAADSPAPSVPDCRRPVWLDASRLDWLPCEEQALGDAPPSPRPESDLAHAAHSAGPSSPPPGSPSQQQVP